MTSKNLISTSTDTLLMETSKLLEESYIADDLTEEQLERIIKYCSVLIRDIESDIKTFS